MQFDLRAECIRAMGFVPSIDHLYTYLHGLFETYEGYSKLFLFPTFPETVSGKVELIICVISSLYV